eukprot:TRINITY_DN23760_c0_g1_i1.p1 TRINITY_DN23760_c0_g1~~TRINITY_DN23760_c0_g1_i1.p1  ORF type:complete len:370 (-),score=76.08 TRINITY_DN23760_c0_g1_i1:283-1392(-)
MGSYGASWWEDSPAGEKAGKEKEKEKALPPDPWQVADPWQSASTSKQDENWWTDEETQQTQHRQDMLQELESWQWWYASEQILPKRTKDEMPLPTREELDEHIVPDCTLKLTGARTEKIPKYSKWDELFRSFKRLLPNDMQENLRRCGYETLAPAQIYTLPAGLAGRDVLCCSIAEGRSGPCSGGTQALLVPTLAGMFDRHRGKASCDTAHAGPCKPVVLILAHARWSCETLNEDAVRLCHNTPFRIVCIQGKEKWGAQLEQLAFGADVLVATPGRLYEYVSAGVVDLSAVRALAVDDVEAVFGEGATSAWELLEAFGLPGREKRQTVALTSAMSSDVERFVAEQLFDPVRIEIEGGNQSQESSWGQPA